MSSVGHLFVGAAASRYALRRRNGPRQTAFAVVLIGIAIAPDLDLAVLPALGVPEYLTLGHRGATHSLVVAVLTVLIASLLAKAVRLPARRIALGAFLAIGSHALLDSLTPGPGVAWLWPFTAARFPTFPILPEAHFDHLLSVGGLVTLLAEVVVFSPLLAYAILWRSREQGER
jgi:inner membrane protein